MLVPVSGRLRLNSFAMAHATVLNGLGIAIFPEFACAADIHRGRLVPVLEKQGVEVGTVRKERRGCLSSRLQGMR